MNVAFCSMGSFSRFPQLHIFGPAQAEPGADSLPRSRAAGGAWRGLQNPTSLPGMAKVAAVPGARSCQCQDVVWGRRGLC